MHGMDSQPELDQNQKEQPVQRRSLCAVLETTIVPSNLPACFEPHEPYWEASHGNKSSSTIR
jgi:hypothetical protein